MALDCGPHTWNSCLNSSGSECKTSDAGFEGTMDIETPDSQTGRFEGWFNPKGGGQRQKITGKCSEQNPHMTVERTDGGGRKHKYSGDKSGTNHVKGKHNKSTAAKGRKAPLDDDEWIATKVT